ncbi:hypothetical protein [Gluconobacter sp. Gdi]|uniref:hypothetical protein n=1 Tax=Gluconobacter sp. Gdi TaxID=2691888 RepID=UPI001920F4B4|nr:hypothetical protein [Gluconobacter sp. Gdi]
MAADTNPKIGILKITRLDNDDLRVKIAISSRSPDISDVILSVTVNGRLSDGTYDFKNLEKEILQEINEDIRNRFTTILMGQF